MPHGLTWTAQSKQPHASSRYHQVEAMLACDVISNVCDLHHVPLPAFVYVAFEKDSPLCLARKWSLWRNAIGLFGNFVIAVSEIYDHEPRAPLSDFQI